MSEGFQKKSIRPIEQPFLRRIEDFVSTVEDRNRPYRTDFLSLREQVLITRRTENSGVHATFFGGFPAAERKRALLLPGDWPVDNSEFGILPLMVELPVNANTMHGHVMGSVLGTGIQRTKIGDIVVFEDRAVVQVADDLATFLMTEWRSVGRIPVEPSVSPDKDLEYWPEPLYVRDIVDVVSLRADAVIAHACHFSRTKAQDAFKRKEVSLNFMELTNPDCPVDEGDILSVRGFGRIQIYGVHGITKSGRQRLEVGVLKSTS